VKTPENKFAGLDGLFQAFVHRDADFSGKISDRVSGRAKLRTVDIRA
jgi:hypothetical protein